MQVVSEYIAKGANLGARNLRGQTALLVACLSAVHDQNDEDHEDGEDNDDDEDNEDNEEYRPAPPRVRAAPRMACARMKVPASTRMNSRRRRMRKFHAKEVAALLIEPTSAADALDAVDDNGMLSLMAARKNGLDDIVKMLLKAGAKPDLTDKKGSTAAGHPEGKTAGTPNPKKNRRQENRRRRRRRGGGGGGRGGEGGGGGGDVACGQDARLYGHPCHRLQDRHAGG